VPKNGPCFSRSFCRGGNHTKFEAKRWPGDPVQARLGVLLMLEDATFCGTETQNCVAGETTM
jgi:hypothetical protein